jgi:hypothetical protein
MSKSGNVFAVNNNRLTTNSQQENSDEARAVQAVQAALVIAKRFPRDQIQAMDRILTACTRPTLAETALYSYSRGGSSITGPSIRLAEAIAQSWGNIDFGFRELSSSDGASTVETFAWDMESNTRQTKVFTVRHERHSRKGVKILTDQRDIYETVANNAARRLRACILGVIPGDVTEAAVNQCEETVRVSVDMSPDGLKKVLLAFEEIGVAKKQVESKIQCRFESIRPAQVVNLRKIYQSIIDEMSAPQDWFEQNATVEQAAEKVESGQGPDLSGLDTAQGKPESAQKRKGGPPPKFV